MLAAFEAGVDESPRPRVLLSKALLIGDGIVEALQAHPASDKVALAGSARRLADSVKDLDVIATASDPPALLKAFAGLDVIESCSTPGENAARARTHTGMAVDLRVVEPDQYGNLLQHLTGSKNHNMALRDRAVRRGLHVSEYGILDDATGETHRCATEEEVYERLGLPWIPPELREDRGELDLEKIPPLVTVEDLRGDLHMHTVASDGRNTVEEMALAARERGYEYIAITDHSASHGFGNHVEPDELRRQIERVRALNAKLEGIEVLIGTESNILPDGSLDYADDLLAELDWVVGSVHTSFSMSSDAMTARVVAACEHPYCDAIGHLTGRKIETRAPYAIDVDAVIAAAARTGTMLEINSAADRRDLNDVHARAAAQGGVRILIDSDAHGVNTLGHRALGRRDGAPRLARPGGRRQHAAVEEVRAAAQARAVRQVAPAAAARRRACRRPAPSTARAAGRRAPRSRGPGRPAPRAARPRGRRVDQPAGRARGRAAARRTGRVRASSPARSRRPAPRAARSRSPRAAGRSRTRARGGAARGTRRAAARPPTGRPRRGRPVGTPATTSSSPARRAAAHAASTRSRPFFSGLAA